MLNRVSRGTSIATGWLLVTFFVMGCSNGNTPQKWVYRFDGKAENLLGLPEAGRRAGIGAAEESNAFLSTHVTIVRHDQWKWAVACNSQAAGTLLLVLKVPEDIPTQWSTSTAAGSLRAWLVRPSAEMFRKRLAGTEGAWMEDLSELCRMADAPSTIREGEFVMPFDGSVEVELDPRGFRRLSVDLTSHELMPVHNEFLRYDAQLAERERETGQADAARAFIGQAPTSLCRIRGVFKGGHFAHPIPM